MVGGEEGGIDGGGLGGGGEKGGGGANVKGTRTFVWMVAVEADITPNAGAPALVSRAVMAAGVEVVSEVAAAVTAAVTAAPAVVAPGWLAGIVAVAVAVRLAGERRTSRKQEGSKHERVLRNESV